MEFILLKTVHMFLVLLKYLYTGLNEYLTNVMIYNMHVLST